MRYLELSIHCLTALLCGIFMMKAISVGHWVAVGIFALCATSGMRAAFVWIDRENKRDY